MKGINGRPATIGSLYFENRGEGYAIRKYCTGYCVCGRKQGMKPEELNEFADNACFGMRGFFARLARTKILIP